MIDYLRTHFGMPMTFQDGMMAGFMMGIVPSLLMLWRITTLDIRSLRDQPWLKAVKRYLDLKSDDDTLGLAAFGHYRDAMGGLTFDGREIPGWLELSEETREAWRFSARKVAEFIVLIPPESK